MNNTLNNDLAINPCFVFLIATAASIIIFNFFNGTLFSSTYFLKIKKILFLPLYLSLPKQNFKEFLCIKHTHIFNKSIFKNALQVLKS